MKFTQWTTPDNKHYFPAGKVIKKLPPGYYTIEQSMQGTFLAKKPLQTEDLLRFPDSNTDAVLREIEKFWLLEDKFRAREIPYKRGILMFGPPGSGKTCALKLIVKNLVEDQKGIIIDFPGANTFKSGYELVRGIHSTMPMVVMMEDIDSLLGRYNQSEVLNLLDGMYGIDKIVFVATTNHPEKLGSRIMNRPSRFDKKFFVGMPNEESRRMYLRHLLAESPEDVERWVGDTEGFSIAHLKELFVATKFLGDEYQVALETLGRMKEAIHSNEFDDYGAIREKRYSRYGTGEIYESFKREYGSKGPKSIANMITEDVDFMNGFKV
jgi:SpoVK/Ycf46/Vps4 family AAA+-type ATPase